MVWVDPKDLGYRPYYERWVRLTCGDGVEVETEKFDFSLLLQQLFDKYVPPCIDYILSGLVDGEMGAKLKQVIPISNIDMVKQLCSSLDVFVSPNITNESDLEGMYLFCVVWALGAALELGSRKKLDDFLKRIGRGYTPSGSVYDFRFEQPNWFS